MNSLVSAVLKGEKVSVSKTLSMVENRESGFLKILDELYVKGKTARVIGVTGSPGVGKSSLISKYVEELVRRGKKVAVIAVDPSSPFTGGAFLGDRTRMPSFENVFVRSVATRGAFGGISDAVFNMIVVFRAAGFDHIIIETVGVGQNEINISKLSDIVLLLMTPGFGDDIQMMKAGITETGDILVLNKADLAGADELESSVKAVNFYKRIIKTSAVKNTGITELSDCIDGLYEEERARITDRAKAILKEGMKILLMQELSCKIEKLLNSADVRLDEITNASISPYKEIQRLVDGGFLDSLLRSSKEEKNSK